MASAGLPRVVCCPCGSGNNPTDIKCARRSRQSAALCTLALSAAGWCVRTSKGAHSLITAWLRNSAPSQCSCTATAGAGPGVYPRTDRRRLESRCRRAANEGPSGAQAARSGPSVLLQGGGGGGLRRQTSRADKPRALAVDRTRKRHGAPSDLLGPRRFGPRPMRAACWSERWTP
jgi:hypothetical protein